MIPNGYAKQSGCYRCKFVFVEMEWDSPDVHYCTFGDTEPRPKCGSVMMKESFFFKEEDEIPDHEVGYDAMGRWHEWSKDRYVDPWGICPKFQATSTGAPGNTNLEIGD